MQASPIQQTNAVIVFIAWAFYALFCVIVRVITSPVPPLNWLADKFLNPALKGAYVSGYRTWLQEQINIVDGKLFDLSISGNHRSFRASFLRLRILHLRLFAFFS